MKYCAHATSTRRKGLRAKEDDDECCFGPRFCNVRLCWAGTTLANRNFIMNHALLQDRSLDLLTSSPARYQYTMDAPWLKKTNCARGTQY